MAQLGSVILDCSFGLGKSLFRLHERDNFVDNRKNIANARKGSRPWLYSVKQFLISFILQNTLYKCSIIPARSCWQIEFSGIVVLSRREAASLMLFVVFW